MGLVAIEGMPEIGPGDEIAALICDRAELCHHDIVVVTQKIVSKAEGRVELLCQTFEKQKSYLIQRWGPVEKPPASGLNVSG